MDGSTFGPVEKLSAILALDNIAEHLPPEELATIGSDVVQEHGIDYSSMKDWRERMERGLDLAALVKKEKTYPWKGAANLKYPLITTAALQFNARAYPAIVPSDDVVKVQVHGNDATGAKAARGERVGQYMSFQLSSEVEEWEETTDELLTVLPIVGTVVRKVWFDPVENRNRVRLIDPRKFVVNASVKVLADAPRIGEEIELYPSEIKSRRLSGFYRDVDYVENAGEDREAARHRLELERDIRNRSDDRDDGDGRSDRLALAVAAGDEVGDRGDAPGARDADHLAQHAPGQHHRQRRPQVDGQEPQPGGGGAADAAEVGPGAAVDRQAQGIDPGVADHAAAGGGAAVGPGGHAEQRQQVGQRRPEYDRGRHGSVPAAALQQHPVTAIAARTATPRIFASPPDRRRP